MNETTNNALPLAAVTNKDKFVCKPGPVYLYNGKSYDLRTISEATAEALANDPRCMFIAWKEESKRPAEQRGVFAPKEKAATPAPAAAAVANEGKAKG